MSKKMLKIEGGQGGKRGHSNMTHWDGTEIIKARSKRARRRQARELERLPRQTAGGDFVS